MIIREATLSDAYGIAKVHVDTWKSTYKGMVSDKFLNELSYEDRETRWKDVINDLEIENKYIYVAVDAEDEIIGYAMCGIERESKDPSIGEIYGIYILEEHQNKGIGRLLLNEASNKLSQLNFNTIIIWVLLENYQARRFYELMGGRPVKEQDIVIAGDTLKEIAYEFELRFQFKDFDYLTDGEIDLLIENKVPANEEKGYVPAYKYRITLHNSSDSIGNIDIRIGDNKGIYY